MTKSGDNIQVSSTDFVVIDGAVVSRTTYDTSSGGSAAAGRRQMRAEQIGALQVSQFAGVQQGLSSAMPIESLIELNFLHVSMGPLCMIMRA